MNKKLLVSFVLASLTGISTQAKEKMSVPGHRPNYLFNREPLGAERTMYGYTKSMDRKSRQARTEKYFHKYPPKNCN